jgi:hypothetical protein
MAILLSIMHLAHGQPLQLEARAAAKLDRPHYCGPNRPPCM